jgi:hypothetical protein
MKLILKIINATESKMETYTNMNNVLHYKVIKTILYKEIMKLIARKKTTKKKQKRYSCISSRVDGRTESKSFMTIDEVLDYACSLPEWLTCVDNELAERAVETNHRILSKGGVREFQLI